MIKTRVFKDKNYKSIYFNGKTIRIALDSTKPIKELKYPEFYDIKITERCQGNCKYCYQDSKENDSHYLDTVSKLKCFFGSMSENEKPFQIAIGGGEPTLSPEFHEIMRVTRELGISPNYTTNGMFVLNNKSECKEIINTTKKYCEGVAVTCHNHLESTWMKAVAEYLTNNIFTNLHILISNKESINKFEEIYHIYRGHIKYFVLLPMLEHGRCKETSMEDKYFFETIDRLKEKYGDSDDIAYGANFYPYLQKHNRNDVDMYEPEIMSKYLDLKDMKLYKSSFNLEEVDSSKL